MTSKPVSSKATIFSMYVVASVMLCELKASCDCTCLLCHQVVKHIWTGPSSVREGPGYHKGRASNAQIAGITKMTPHTIAYAACQVGDAGYTAAGLLTTGHNRHDSRFATLRLGGRLIGLSILWTFTGR